MDNHEHAHESSCSCHSDLSGSELKIFGVRLLLAFILAFVFYFWKLPTLWQILGFGMAYLLAGYDVLLNAGKNILKGKVFDENFLMSIASIGAFAIGEMSEAVAVMIFYGVGEMLQDAAVARSKDNIVKLMDLRPDHANLKIDKEIRSVSPEEVKLGDIIIVKPGEKIPLDGVVLSGEAFIDARALTGESVPKKVVPGDEVYAGAINTDSLLEITVSREFSESAVSKIIDLVRNASGKKSASEKFITRFAKVYTPVVVGIAIIVAIAPPLLGMDAFSVWIYRALCFLIISCPCALVLSIPLSFFGGIGGAARHGILVKGGNHLELLDRLGTVVFDKTGTLTKGVFEVSKLHTASGVSSDELLRIAAIAENHSNHPIAKSILKAWGKDIVVNATIREDAGLGVTAECTLGIIHAGNAKLMRKIGINNLDSYPQTTVHVALNGKYLGCILIADELKPGIKAALADLHKNGVERLVMLTGDQPQIAQEIANETGLDDFKAGLMPQDKVVELEEIMRNANPNKKTAFVGDGINDAPVLARADLGIAMGGVGSDAAIEAADVVLINDEISSLSTAMKIAAKTKMIVLENITLSLVVKFAVMALALIGYASVWFAIFADVGVALIALGNAVRAFYYKDRKTT